MRIMAQEMELKPLPEDAQQILSDEAQHVHALHQSGIVQEIYFNQEHCAIVFLETEDLDSAQQILAQFPLVRNGYIRFECHALLPYTGWERL